jgi:hypothetical protein
MGEWIAKDRHGAVENSDGIARHGTNLMKTKAILADADFEWISK